LQAAQRQATQRQSTPSRHDDEENSALNIRLSALSASLSATELIANYLANTPSGSLDEAQSKQLFAHFGIPSAAECVVTTAAQAEQAALELGGRVVLKLLCATITHKSDIGGVAINLSATDIGARLTRMRADVARHTGTAPQRFLVQEMVHGGTEMILGMHRDPLGTAILLGMGGVTAELFGDTTLRLLPPGGGLSADDAQAMLRELKTWPLLDGFRGRPKADVAALVKAIVDFSNMVAQLGERLEVAEINPLFVLNAGLGVRAADGVAVVVAVAVTPLEIRG
jgi:succinyl-CoA synthetase beta subunit